MIVYADSSALVKLLVDEDGSDTVARLWDAADLVACSPLGHVEVCAALAAAARAGRLTASDHDTAVTRWSGDFWPAVAQVPLSHELATRAGELAQRAALRGVDAVHAASALAIPGAVLVAWDDRLRTAASALGLSVAPVAT